MTTERPPETPRDRQAGVEALAASFIASMAIMTIAGFVIPPRIEPVTLDHQGLLRLSSPDATILVGGLAAFLLIFLGTFIAWVKLVRHVSFRPLRREQRGWRDWTWEVPASLIAGSVAREWLIGVLPHAGGLYFLDPPFDREALNVVAFTDFALAFVLWFGVSGTLLILLRVLREQLLHPYDDNATRRPAAPAPAE